MGALTRSCSSLYTMRARVAFSWDTSTVQESVMPTLGLEVWGNGLR